MGRRKMNALHSIIDIKSLSSNGIDSIWKNTLAQIPCSIEGIIANLGNTCSTVEGMTMDDAILLISVYLPVPTMTVESLVVVKVQLIVFDPLGISTVNESAKTLTVLNKVQISAKMYFLVFIMIFSKAPELSGWLIILLLGALQSSVCRMFAVSLLFTANIFPTPLCICLRGLRQTSRERLCPFMEAIPTILPIRKQRSVIDTMSAMSRFAFPAEHILSPYPHRGCTGRWLTSVPLAQGCFLYSQITVELLSLPFLTASGTAASGQRIRHFPYLRRVLFLWVGEALFREE